MARHPFELRFRIGPFQVAIEPTFWLVIVLFGLLIDIEGVGNWASALRWFGVVLLTLFSHELGHALVAWRYGAQASIRLYALGGVSSPETLPSRRSLLLVLLAGPAANLALALAAWSLAVLFEPDPPAAKAFLKMLALVSLVWGGINLLPVLPFDAGHLLFALLGNEGRKTACLVGAAAAIALAAGSAAVGWLLPTFVFAVLAVRSLQLRAHLGPSQRIREHSAKFVEQGWVALRSGEEEEAERLARSALETAQDPDGRNQCRDLLAWALLAQDDGRGALRQLELSEPPEAARPLSWAMVLQALNDKAGALPYAVRAYETEPSETTARLAIRLLVGVGRLEEARTIAGAFAWPRRAAHDAALGEIAFSDGAFPAAAERFQAAFEASRLPEDAVQAARSLARAGRGDEAVHWLQRALEAGLPHLERLSSDPDFASLRDHPGFRGLLESAHA